jgi:hypothetical protein
MLRTPARADPSAGSRLAGTHGAWGYTIQAAGGVAREGFQGGENGRPRLCNPGQIVAAARKPRGSACQGAWPRGELREASGQRAGRAPLQGRPHGGGAPSPLRGAGCAQTKRARRPGRPQGSAGSAAGGTPAAGEMHTAAVRARLPGAKRAPVACSWHKPSGATSEGRPARRADHGGVAHGCGYRPAPQAGRAEGRRASGPRSSRVQAWPSPLRHAEAATDT